MSIFKVNVIELSFPQNDGFKDSLSTKNPTQIRISEVIKPLGVVFVLQFSI